MRFSGRFVRVFQWIAPAVLPMMLFYGRLLFGGPPGWFLVFGVFLAPIMTLALYIPPIIAVFDREARAVKSTRLSYNIASWVTWAAVIGMTFTLVDVGDAPGSGGSVLTAWGLSESLNAILFIVFISVLFIGWIAAIVCAVIAVTVGRRAPLGAGAGQIPAPYAANPYAANPYAPNPYAANPGAPTPTSAPNPPSTPGPPPPPPGFS
ncbi:hypothetical protein [Microbacterium sp. GXF6406]